MTTQTNESNVYSAIKSGFSDFRILARASLKQKWPKMSIGDRYAVGRALVFINRVATNPEKYFSREKTCNDWVARGDKWNMEHGLPKGDFHAFYIVPSPTDVVVNESAAAFIADGNLMRKYYNFCKDIQNWEYDRTASKSCFRERAYEFGDKITRDAAELQKLAEIHMSGPVQGCIKRLVYSFQH